MIVMRFKQREGQPLPMRDMCGHAWKKKTPAQRRRDRQRSERHHQGEQTNFDTNLSPETFEVNVANSVVPDRDVARSSRPNDPTDCVTGIPMTSDPGNSSEKPDETAVLVSNMDPPTERDHQSDSSRREATVEDLWEIVANITKSFSPSQKVCASTLLRREVD